MTMQKNNLIDLKNQIADFKLKQTQQKQRGFNDYNILTTVLKSHDEVRVHSRMIGSLLDTEGNHYQGTLFLEMFLDAVDIQNYDHNNSTIKLEYENIDLYLTDGKKHIIIENKIYASDQKAQLERYINIIKNNTDINNQNLYVIYLSIDRLKPSRFSLGDLKIHNNQIQDTNNKIIAQFINLHYSPHIIGWLKRCRHEVQNITNLNESIKQYTDVVKMITGSYMGKVKKYRSFFMESPNRYKLFNDSKNEFTDISNFHEVENEFNEAKRILLNQFYKRLFGDIIDDTLLYYKYDDNKSYNLIRFIFCTYYDVSIYMNKKRTKLVSIGIRIKEGYKPETKINTSLKNFEHTDNGNYVIGEKKGVKLNAEAEIPRPTVKNLFSDKESKLENSLIKELKMHLKILQKEVKL